MNTSLRTAILLAALAGAVIAIIWPNRFAVAVSTALIAIVLLTDHH